MHGLSSQIWWKCWSLLLSAQGHSPLIRLVEERQRWRYPSHVSSLSRPEGSAGAAAFLLSLPLPPTSWLQTDFNRFLHAEFLLGGLQCRLPKSFTELISHGREPWRLIDCFVFKKNNVEKRQVGKEIASSLWIEIDNMLWYSGFKDKEIELESLQVYQSIWVLEVFICVQYIKQWNREKTERWNILYGKCQFYFIHNICSWIWMISLKSEFILFRLLII